MLDKFTEFKKHVKFKKNAAEAWYGLFELPSYTLSYVAAADQNARAAKSMIADKLYIAVTKYCDAHNIDLALILSEKSLKLKEKSLAKAKK